MVKKIIILIGCYQYSNSSPLLDRSISELDKNATNDKCVESCRFQRYPLVGLYNRMCFCGDTSIDYLQKFQVDEGKCNKKCLIGSSNDCSGNRTMSIYHTGSLSTGNTFTVPSTLQDPGKHLFQIHLYHKQHKKIYNL